jgi:hypothetical protein
MPDFVAAMPIHISKQHGNYLTPTDSLNGRQIDTGCDQFSDCVALHRMRRDPGKLQPCLARATSKRAFNISR